MSKVELFNERIRRGELEGEELVLGSLDVEALYPSIDTMLAGKIVKERIMASELRLEGIDWRWLLIYLSLTMTPADKVDNKLLCLLPRRASKQGKPPTNKTVDLDAKKWYSTKLERITPEQMKHLLGCAMEHIVRLVFRTHF